MFLGVLTMSDKLQENAELISALVDGQLRGDEFAQAVDYLGSADDAQGIWDTYHLVGEVMRSAATPVRAHDPLFIQRLRREIASGTAQLTPVETLAEISSSKMPSTISVANDGWWRRVAGLASVALFGVLAWQGINLIGAGGTPEATSQMAQRVTQPDALVTVAANDGGSAVMIRDPQLDALLAAHRQLGGATGLQMSSGFLRHASFSEGGL